MWWFAGSAVWRHKRGIYGPGGLGRLLLLLLFLAPPHLPLLLLILPLPLVANPRHGSSTGQARAPHRPLTCSRLGGMSAAGSVLPTTG